MSLLEHIWKLCSSRSLHLCNNGCHIWVICWWKKKWTSYMLKDLNVQYNDVNVSKTEFSCNKNDEKWHNEHLFIANNGQHWHRENRNIIIFIQFWLNRISIRILEQFKANSTNSNGLSSSFISAWGRIKKIITFFFVCFQFLCVHYFFYQYQGRTYIFYSCSYRKNLLFFRTWKCHKRNFFVCIAETIQLKYCKRSQCSLYSQNECLSIASKSYKHFCDRISSHITTPTNSSQSHNTTKKTVHTFMNKYCICCVYQFHTCHVFRTIVLYVSVAPVCHNIFYWELSVLPHSMENPQNIVPIFPLLLR